MALTPDLGRRVPAVGFEYSGESDEQEHEQRPGAGELLENLEIAEGPLTSRRRFALLPSQDRRAVHAGRARRSRPARRRLTRGSCALFPRGYSTDATWLERVKPPHGEIKVSTWKSYESHVRVHLLPDPIADRRVADVTTTDVEDLFRRLLDKGLSAASVDAVRRTLRRALNTHKKLAVNPVRGASSPRVPRHEVDVDRLWTHDQARRFLARAEKRDRDMAVLVRLGLDSGARLGELLATTWPDVDLTRQTVRFIRSVSAKRLPGDEQMLRFDTPENDKARTLDVDASTIEALRSMRERQIAEGVSDVGQLVFRRPTRTGFQPWRPHVTTHAFQRLSAEAGVPIVPFHYLRHSCASWLLGAGLDVVAVSERLGHWSPSLTLSVYAHAIRGRQRELAQAIGTALR